MAKERGTVAGKRWNDPSSDDDGTRILVCRYRPRGVSKADETWTEWQQALAPSAALHAAYYGKDASAPPLTFDAYRARFLDEMRGAFAAGALAALAERVAAGESITLLCSSACTDPALCHRTLLRELIEARLRPMPRRVRAR